MARNELLALKGAGISFLSLSLVQFCCTCKCPNLPIFSPTHLCIHHACMHPPIHPLIQLCNKYCLWASSVPCTEVALMNKPKAGRGICMGSYVVDSYEVSSCRLWFSVTRMDSAMHCLLLRVSNLLKTEKNFVVATEFFTLPLQFSYPS